jgi:hypothetical protein
MDATRAAIASGDTDYGAQKQAANDANCTDIKTSVERVRSGAIQRRAAPSPVNTIRDTTCFVDVFKIAIPQLGSGFISGMLNDLVQRAAGNGCNSTGSFWKSISTAASTGNLAGLVGPAITQGTKYVAQEFSAVTPTSYRQMPTPVPYKPTPLPSGQPTAPQVAMPAAGWGASGYAMCGNVATISEDVSNYVSQSSWMQTATYRQAMMSRGIGYSLSFTTGDDAYDLASSQDVDLSSFVGTIAARITNANTAGAMQKMALSTQGCDFAGASGTSVVNTSPTISFLVTRHTNIPSGIARLEPNTTYYLNYYDSDGSNFTCPIGASCDFEVDFKNANAGR